MMRVPAANVSLVSPRKVGLGQVQRQPLSHVSTNPISCFICVLSNFGKFRPGKSNNHARLECFKCVDVKRYVGLRGTLASERETLYGQRRFIYLKVYDQHIHEDKPNRIRRQVRSSNRKLSPLRIPQTHARVRTPIQAAGAMRSHG